MRIAQRFQAEIAFRVMATNNRPDFRTISNFRTENLGELSSLFVQALELCRKADLNKTDIALRPTPENT